MYLKQHLDQIEMYRDFANMLQNHNRPRISDTYGPEGRVSNDPIRELNSEEPSFERALDLKDRIGEMFKVDNLPEVKNRRAKLDAYIDYVLPWVEPKVPDDVWEKLVKTFPKGGLEILIYGKATMTLLLSSPDGQLSIRTYYYERAKVGKLATAPKLYQDALVRNKLRNDSDADCAKCHSCQQVLGIVQQMVEHQDEPWVNHIGFGAVWVDKIQRNYSKNFTEAIDDIVKQYSE